MDPNYGERYRELFHRHWWWRARTEFIVHTLERLQPPQGWSQILDVGCGDGLFFERLSQFGAIEGVEPSVELVDPNNPHINRIYIRPFDHTFQPGKLYSLVLMLDVLEHLNDPLAALKHVHSLLHPDGTLIATVPAFRILWTNHDVLNHHVERYTKARFNRLAQLAGLRVAEARYFYHWTFLAKLGVRAYERVTGAVPTPASVPPAFLNQSLYGLCRIEQSTISRLPIPFGSSLIVVARKGLA